MGGDMAGNEMSGSAIGMPHDEHVAEHGLDISQGVEQAFSLGGGGGRDIDIQNII